MSSPPWTYQGPLYNMATATAMPSHYSYMTTYFGLFNAPKTPNADVRLCSSLLSADGTMIMQNILLHHAGAPVHNWVLVDTWTSPAGIVTSAETPFVQNQGVWGVVWFQGGGSQWVIRSYRGNTGNTLPNFNKPVSAGLTLPVSATVNPSLKNVVMTQAVCSVEVPPPPPTEAGYACNDITLLAVFARTELKDNTFTVPPVSWGGGNVGLPSGGVTCAMSSTIVKLKAPGP